MQQLQIKLRACLHKNNQLEKEVNHLKKLYENSSVDEFDLQVKIKEFKEKEKEQLKRIKELIILEAKQGKIHKDLCAKVIT